jgi:hypothetical protein
MDRADQRKFHYIYKITREDGKYYIGLHSTNNLDDGYFGSGQMLWHSIKKYGKDKHKKTILEFLPSRHHLKSREAELVNSNTLLDPLCMNLRIGGGASATDMGKSSREKISEAQKRRDPSTRKHSEETKRKIALSNRKPKDPLAVRRSVDSKLSKLTPEIRAKLGGNRGKTMSDEQKTKISVGVRASITPEIRSAASTRAKSMWTAERRASHAAKMRAYHARKGLQ